VGSVTSPRGGHGVAAPTTYISPFASDARSKKLSTVKKTVIVAFAVLTFTFLPDVTAQTINPVGRYVYKTHREGRGGFHNSLEIAAAQAGRFRVSFEGTYFYIWQAGLKLFTRGRGKATVA